jgi:hypothetical protein
VTDPGGTTTAATPLAPLLLRAAPVATDTPAASAALRNIADLANPAVTVDVRLLAGTQSGGPMTAVTMAAGDHAGSGGPVNTAPAAAVRATLTPVPQASALQRIAVTPRLVQRELVGNADTGNAAPALSSAAGALEVNDGTLPAAAASADREKLNEAAGSQPETIGPASIPAGPEEHSTVQPGGAAWLEFLASPVRVALEVPTVETITQEALGLLAGCLLVFGLHQATGASQPMMYRPEEDRRKSIAR